MNRVDRGQADLPVAKSQAVMLEPKAMPRIAVVVSERQAFVFAQLAMPFLVTRDVRGGNPLVV